MPRFQTPPETPGSLPPKDRRPDSEPERHIDPFTAAFICIGVTAAVLEFFIYVMVTANLAAAALAAHAFYHLFIDRMPNATRVQRRRHANRLRRGVRSIIASNTSCLAAYIAILVIP